MTESKRVIRRSDNDCPVKSKLVDELLMCAELDERGVPEYREIDFRWKPKGKSHSGNTKKKPSKKPKP